MKTGKRRLGQLYIYIYIYIYICTLCQVERNQHGVGQRIRHSTEEDRVRQRTRRTPQQNRARQIMTYTTEKDRELTEPDSKTESKATRQSTRLS